MTHEELKAAAVSMLDRAYVPTPTSRWGPRWSAADGTVFTGCNVENASYPAGICAERNAICPRRGGGAHGVPADCDCRKGRGTFCVPCGICRQVMREFAPEMQIICINGKGQTLELTLRDLLPYSFDSTFLPQNGEK